MLEKNRLSALICRAVVILLVGVFGAECAQAQRLLGLDISAWQGNISQTTWNNLRTVENRQFVFIRSSRGGTTGFYDQNDADNSNGKNTLSQRYDDPYFVQNINRATAAGIYAGSYHFSRPEIIESTPNSGGIRNSGADEADHFIQMAGAWMRPGYLVPIHDLESGDGIRTDNEMAQFSIDFSNRIFQRMGIRPGIYVNGNYTANILQTASAALRDQLAKPAANRPSMVAPCYPVLWVARWPNQTNPNAIDVQGTDPKDTYAGFYGPWDDYGDSNPWTFWQYASTGRLQSFNGGANNLDFDAAHGDVEFLRDQLVPAVWMNNGSGDWSTLANWNSGQTPVAPVTGAGQVAPVGTQTLPTPRLPGAAGSGVASGQYDTVILERTNANITVTVSSGTHNVRKLYMREALNITGGSLTINYDPNYVANVGFPESKRSGPISAQFSGPVTLGGTGRLNVHTLQVDAARTFSLNSGTLTFDTITLMPGATAGKIAVNGGVTVNALRGVMATIANGVGSGGSGSIDLGGGDRSLVVNDAAAEVDLSIQLPIVNGALTKDGAGTMRLTAANSYTGGTTISGGTLLVNNITGSGTGSGPVTVDGGTLRGTGIVGGVVTVFSGGTLAAGTSSSIGNLTLDNPPVLIGTNFMRINRSGAASLADKVTVTAGTLNFGGTLVVSNVGAALMGGEVFTNFAAANYAGNFNAFELPVLGGGLNWFTGMLAVNGTIAVNRGPVVDAVFATNEPPGVLEIPLATLLAGARDVDGDPIEMESINLTTMNGVTLTTNGTSLYYSNYVNVPDQFTYVVSDGRGGSATGTVFIAASPAGRFASAPSASGNGLTLQAVGRPGWTYYLERSTNLTSWITISTNVAPASGLFDFVDADPPQPAAFYKLRTGD